MNYERVIGMLPSELKQDGRATMFKHIIGIYSSYADGGDILNNAYGSVLDIFGAVSEEIDFIGAMYGIFRNENETDEMLRERITNTVINRKTPTTIPELQQAMDAIVSSGKLYILENHQGKPCNVYITGTSDEESINRALSLIRQFLPAGVRSIIPVASFEKWQNIKDQFTSWNSLGEEGYIW